MGGQSGKPTDFWGEGSHPWSGAALPWWQPPPPSVTEKPGTCALSTCVAWPLAGSFGLYLQGCCLWLCLFTEWLLFHQRWGLFDFVQEVFEISFLTFTQNELSWNTLIVKPQAPSLVPYPCTQSLAVHPCCLAKRPWVGCGTDFIECEMTCTQILIWSSLGLGELLRPFSEICTWSVDPEKKTLNILYKKRNNHLTSVIFIFTHVGRCMGQVLYISCWKILAQLPYWK